MTPAAGYFERNHHGYLFRLRSLQVRISEVSEGQFRAIKALLLVFLERIQPIKISTCNSLLIQSEWVNQRSVITLFQEG